MTRAFAWWLALAATTGAAGVFAACGGSQAASEGFDGGQDATNEAGDAIGDATSADAADASDASSASDAPSKQPPLPGSNFALHTWYLGDTDRDGGADQNAWKQYGTNVDGKTTTAASTDVCTLYAGAPKSAQVDGDSGIDNSWGENILPIILTTTGANFSAQYNAAVSSGSFTEMIDVTGLTSDPTQSGAAPGQGFVGAQFPGTPTWTMADDWPVVPDWLNDGKTLASGSRIAFAQAVIASGTWTSGAPTDLPFHVQMGTGYPLDFIVHHAVVRFVHSSATKATEGIISGIVYTDEVIAAFQRVAGSISMSLCSGSAFDSIAQQIRQAQDILQNGTNDPGVPCDAISFGIGFDADQLGPVQSVAPEQPPLPDPCGDAGTD